MSPATGAELEAAQEMESFLLLNQNNLASLDFYVPLHVCRVF